MLPPTRAIFPFLSRRSSELEHRLFCLQRGLLHVRIRYAKSLLDPHLNQQEMDVLEEACMEVIPTPSRLLDRISPISSPFFPVFCAFSPSRRGGSNEPKTGIQGQETVSRAPKHRFAGLANSELHLLQRLHAEGVLLGHLAAQRLDVRHRPELARPRRNGVWTPLPPFLGPGFRLAARWNRLGETVKTREKRGKTGKNGRDTV